MNREEIMRMSAEELDTRLAALNEETRTADADRLAEINEELDAIEERRAQLEQAAATRNRAAAAVATGAGRAVANPVAAQNVDVRNSEAYINAFAEYIRTGNDAECRSLLTDNVSPGGTVPVPDFVLDEVKTAWEKEGVMALVRKSYLKGNLKVGFEIDGGEATNHTEGGAAVSEEDLTLGVVELVPGSIKKWISISDEVYDLRGEAFLRYIYNELSYRIAKKAADNMIAKIEACGTVSTTTCPGVPKHAISSPSVGDVAAALALLSDEAANPVVIMNKVTWGAYKAAQYAGQFNVDPFEGLNVVFNNKIKAFGAATTGETIAIVGDLGHGALANFPNGEGITFKFDEMSRKKEDLIEVLGRQFVALGVVAPDAFVKLTQAAKS